MKSILITGGAGFIGSHLIRLFVKKYPEYKIYNLDKLTYAGNLENISDIEGFKNYRFIKGDICDIELLAKIFIEYGPFGALASARGVRMGDQHGLLR